MVDFLLEIGCEEIPAFELERAATNLEETLLQFLKEKNIFFRSSRLFYTPRRLGIIILGIARRQREEIVEIQGPPKKFAYDEHNNPTQMLNGFMRSQNLTLRDITIKKTPKGEYVIGQKIIQGRDTKELLIEFLPGLIGSLSFTKTMRWDETKVRFARPVRWLVALFDTRILPLRFGKIEAGKKTFVYDRGERIAVKLGKPRDHLLNLRKEGVITEPMERRKVILQKISRMEKKVKKQIVRDEELINELINLTEYPEVAVGKFSDKYLTLPTEVLITVLKVHQRIFAFDKTNRFLVVFNGTKRMSHAVQRGFERVVQARLEDALYYYNRDLNYGLEKMVDDLKGIVWLEGIGTVYDKVQRLVKLSAYLAAEINKRNNNRKVDGEILAQASRYAKADLVSQMVREKEFTRLQGVMGKYYALQAGLPKEVAQAIYEHYLPRFAGDDLPKSLYGSLLGIIDRLDTIIGAFIMDLQPTGSQDPLGLRRQAYSLVQIILENNLHLSLTDLVNEIIKLYNRDLKLAPKIISFIYERFARYLEEKNIAYDEIKAVLVTEPSDLNDAFKKSLALKAFRARDDFHRLVIGQKRVANILKNVKFPSTINTEMLKEPAEIELYKKGEEIAGKLKPLLKEKNYKSALALLLSLRENIDRLFDNVLVMAEDKRLRENRLALVNFIHALFLQVADLSQIVLEGEEIKTNP